MCEINLTSSEELVSAFETKDYEKTKNCLEKHHNVESAVQKGYKTLAHIACFAAWREGIELLISFGANLESLDKEEMTPIFMAISSGKLDFIKFMLEEVKVNAFHLEDQGRTIFYWGSVIGDMDLINYLIGKYPEMVNQPSKMGRTPLSKAAWNGRIDVADRILETGIVKI